MVVWCELSGGLIVAPRLKVVLLAVFQNAKIVEGFGMTCVAGDRKLKALQYGSVSIQQAGL
eukprot:m.174933 g.174933  ORF g.174933 m.174933 type:complete len:61 (+) comp10419_c0_seq2:270-452(+)